MIKAAITPGTHPNTVRINTINIDPHPLSMTESGGKMMAKITLQMLINYVFNLGMNVIFKNRV
jgi:hypothetical protein